MSDKITYKGVTAIHAKNHHVVLIHNDRIIAHFSCNKKKSEQELKELIDFYLSNRCEV